MTFWRAAVMVVGLCGPVLALGEENCPVQPGTLKAMRECYRPVLVFAASAKDAAFVRQQKMLDEYADEMMDRDLLYVPVLGRREEFAAPLDAPYVMVDTREMGRIRARFGVDAGKFALVLVGKDGGEKFRSWKPVTVLKLDEIVDAMPMGRLEKKQRSGAAGKDGE